MKEKRFIWKKTSLVLLLSILLFLNFLVVFPIPEVSASDPWYNSNWDYRKCIHVDYNLKGYQSFINVSKSSGGDVDCEGNCQNDFDDIRFTDSSGNVLPHWKENYTAGSYAWFWVNSSTYNDTTWYMYYGNAGAGDSSNADNTFIWVDEWDSDNTGDYTSSKHTSRDAYLYTQDLGKTYHSFRLRTHFKGEIKVSGERSAQIKSGLWNSSVYDDSLGEASFIARVDTDYGSTSSKIAYSPYLRDGYGGTVNSSWSGEQHKVWYINELRFNNSNNLKSFLYNDNGDLVRQTVLGGYMSSNLSYIGYKTSTNTESTVTHDFAYDNDEDGFKTVRFKQEATSWCEVWKWVDWMFLANYTAYNEPALTFSQQSTESNSYNNFIPSFSNPIPANESTNINMQPTVNVTITDLNGNQSTCNFYTSDDGISWTWRQTNTSVLNESIEYDYTQAKYRNNIYYWKVTANDGHYNNSVIYHFTTLPNTLPVASNETPSNNTLGVATTISVFSVDLTDGNGDLMNWSIETYPDIGSSNANNEGNGTKTCSLSGVQPATEYTVYVNVSDTTGGSFINETYIFTTFGTVKFYCYNESNPSQSISTFSVEVTNSDGSEVYLNSSFTHGGSVSFYELPHGEDIYFLINASGYNHREYHLEVSETVNMSFVFYLPPENNTYLYYISVLDVYDVGIKDALVLFKRNLGGTYVNVSSLVTSSTGACNIFLLPYTTYKISISKTNYITEMEDWIPSDNIFTKEFQMDLDFENVSLDETIWDNITWNIDPTYPRHETNITFYFNITSSNNRIQWYRMRIQYFNNDTEAWETEFYQNNSDAGGGSISYTCINKTGRFRLDAWFKKQGFDEFQFGDGMSCRYYYITWADLIESLDDMPDTIYFLIIIVLAIAGIAVLLQMGAGELSGIAGLFVMGIGVILRPALVISGIMFWQVVVASAIAYVAIMYLVGRI